MSDTEVPSPGFSGSIEAEYDSRNGGDVGGGICYTNSDSTFTGCGSGSTDNGGSVGISLTFRF